MFGKTTIKFQQWIVLSASALVLLLALVFLGTVFGKFRETAQRGATDRFELITQGIAEHLQLSLDAHARRASALAAADVSDVLARQAGPVASMVAVLKKSVRENPGVYGEYLGLSNGDFLQVIGVRGHAATLQALDAPAGTELAVRVIQADATGTRHEQWWFLDRADQTLGERRVAARYTPLDRPWYQGALRASQASVTAPYVFDSTEREGLTISAALPRGHGAYGVDISLDAFMNTDSFDEAPPGGIDFDEDDATLLPHQVPDIDDVFDVTAEGTIAPVDRKLVDDDDDDDHDRTTLLR